MSPWDTTAVLVFDTLRVTFKSPFAIIKFGYAQIITGT